MAGMPSVSDLKLSVRRIETGLAQQHQGLVVAKLRTPEEILGMPYFLNPFFWCRFIPVHEHEA